MNRILQIAIGLLFTGWTLCSCQYPCGKASSGMVLVSFSDAESDTIIVRRFNRNKNYLSLYDSVILTRLNSNFQRQNDSLIIFHPSNDGNEIITGDYDYEIFLPRVNRLFQLSDIAENIEHGNKGGGKTYCLNTFKSFRINGQAVSAEKYGDRIYFKK